MKGRSSYDELADRIRALARHEAHAVSPPVQRFKVTSANPLIIEEIHGDLVLEEGDPDVEIDRGVLSVRPAVGDMVRVHHDGEDWIIAGVVS